MAQTVRNLPASYPQPLGSQILKADAQRQLSMVRQEVVTDLLTLLTSVRDPSVRERLVKLLEAHLKSGISAAQRSQDLWPEAEAVKKLIESDDKRKPTASKKFLRLFEQYDRVQRRSLALLEESFGHARVILDRIQPVEPVSPPPAVAPPSAKVRNPS